MRSYETEYSNHLEEQIDEFNDEINSLANEIKDTHIELTKLGVGKEHWSLPGRIHALLIVIATDDNPIEKLQKICEENSIRWDGMYWNKKYNICPECQSEMEVDEEHYATDQS